jgi:hypothetical protein
MEQLAPLLADCSPQEAGPASYSGWSGETILWCGQELGYVATYSEVRVEGRRGQ